MSRYSSSGSYAHYCFKVKSSMFDDWYQISWTVDYYSDHSRLRFPRQFTRNTDERGAKRFCKRHEIDFEAVKNEGK